MDEWLKNLWVKNRILFWIAFIVVAPILAILMFKDLILKAIVGKANEELGAAKVADATLKEKELASNSNAEELRGAANALESQINKIKDDEDWNKKRGGSTELKVLACLFAIGVVYSVLRFFL